MLPLEIFTVVTLALLLDVAIGDPKRLYALIPHPVVWIGRTIGLMDEALNRPEGKPLTKKIMGILFLISLCSGMVVIGVLTSGALAPHYWGWVAEAFLISIFLAGKSLADHVAAVRYSLMNADLDEGREAVSAIVGRDTEALDAAGVVRAAIESLAENFSDGVVAPVFWALLFGLPGILVYKAVNTADSMIGHKSEKYRDFGWGAARLDDLLNWIPARISGVLILVGAAFSRGLSAAAGFRAIVHDARHHRSPNAGYPEAAMAGVLGVRLAGPRRYGDEVVEDAWMGEGREDATPDDIGQALRVYWMALGVLALDCGALSGLLL